jgi:hypothetical protein
MKEIFTSTFLKWLWLERNKSKTKRVIINCLIFLFPVWYIVDIIDNILEYICTKVFLDLPLWSYKQLNKSRPEWF